MSPSHYTTRCFPTLQMTLKIKVKVSPVGDIYDVTIVSGVYSHERKHSNQICHSHLNIVSHYPQAEDATIADVKRHVSEQISIPVAAQRLIYRGKMLKDDDNVKSLGFFDGCTVLLLKVRVPSAVTHATNATPGSDLPAVAPQGTSITPAQPWGNGSDNLFAMMMKQWASKDRPLTDDMARQVNARAEVTQKMACDPTLQPVFESMARSFFSNPELVFQCVPQMKALCDQYPDFRNFMSNPDVPGTVMRMLSNPSLMREMVSANERVQHVRATASGEAAITNAHQEVPDPLMDAIERSHAREEDGDATGGAETAGGAGGAGAGASDTNSLLALVAAEVKGNNDAEVPLPDSRDLTRAIASLPVGNVSFSTIATALANGTVTASAGPDENMVVANADTNTDANLAGNTNLIADLISRLHMPALTDEQRTYMNDDTVIQFVEALAANPAVCRAIMPKDNPLLNFFLGSDDMIRCLPQMLRIQRDMNNAMSRDTTTVVDETITKNDESTGSGDADAAPAPADIGAGARTAANAGDADGNASAESVISRLRTIQSSAPQTGAANANPFAAFFEKALAGNLGGQNARPASCLPSATAAEQRANATTMYASQLEALADMGFVDRESNLTALIQTGGNLEAAMDYILRCSS